MALMMAAPCLMILYIFLHGDHIRYRYYPSCCLSGRIMICYEAKDGGGGFCKAKLRHLHIHREGPTISPSMFLENIITGILEEDGKSPYT